MVLMVTGLGVIASMMGVFNFAHGEFLLLGAYTVFLTHSYGYPVWVGMVAAPFVVAIVGLGLERGVIRFFYAEPVVAMLGTYAIGLVIRESVRGLIGGLYHSVPDPLIGSFSLGGVQLSRWRCVIILVTAVVLVAFWCLLTRTGLGLTIRASLENPALARASVSHQQGLPLTFASARARVPRGSDGADLLDVRGSRRALLIGFLAVLMAGRLVRGPALGARWSAR